MKKLFTFVFCVLCAVGVWGTEYTIDDGNANTVNFAPFDNYYNYNLVQLLYLQTDLSSAEAGNITTISFKFASSKVISRTVDIYMSNTSTSKFTAFIPVTAAQKVFSGSVSTVANDWYTITLTTPFAWDGSSNILVTIDDNSGSLVNAQYSHYKNDLNVFTIKRVAYYKHSSGTDDPNIDPTNPSSYTATCTADVPKVKFNIEKGSTPAQPTLNATGTTAIGVIDPAFETKDVVLTITGENLDEDVTIACAEGLSCTNNQIAKETVMATGGAQVTISTTNDFNVEGAKVTFTSGTATKEVNITGTAASYHSPTNGATFFNYSNASVSPYFGYVYYTVSNLTISDVANSQFKPYSTADFMVDYSSVGTTCANGGKVTNLKGKFKSATVFKAFSFDYTAPEETGIVIDEEVDNHDTWPEDAQLKDLIIKRTIVPNQWNSIVLPTRLTSTEVGNIFGTNTDVEAFTSAVVTSSNIELNFTPKTDGLEAGTPYLIKPTKEVENPLNLQNHSFTKTVTPIDHDGIRFEGVLVPTEIDGGDGSDYIIVGANNTLFHPTGEGIIKGMRAYFHVVGSTAKAALKTAKVSMNTGSTTELVLVKDNQTKPYKTMVNDQIVIVNEGKQINILGQIIK